MRAICRWLFIPGAQDSSCSGPSYVAEIANGKLTINQAGANTKVFGLDPVVRLSANSVLYEAQNNGEFGGKLEAVLKSGERRLILKGNVQSLIPVGADLFVFEGLDHMGMSTGSIHRVNDYDRDPKPSPQPITFLPDTPVFVASVANKHSQQEFWVVGTRSLVSVVIDWRRLQVHSWNEFQVRRVSSFIEDDRGVLIGIRRFRGNVVARIATALSNRCQQKLKADDLQAILHERVPSDVYI